ncbi:ABC transporter transmembrane domain-containing protein [Bartonella sp. HY761]|uniref:ABC transporter transmembrane domain-containing protein n=1 Tax=Bartonella sp. HY761 TaxID=2979330 RepID=UPI0021F97672|nr:ABC transporter transmembrane domain-containing protein [Bartonella sp. HY761]UXN06531.1 ABC transporter transmembrane domain-containing protein [Bartonella sp. HY761]
MALFRGKKDEKNSKNQKNGKKTRPLKVLFPYIKRNRGICLGALISLIVAALVMLALPIAIRRMLDHGFSDSSGEMINSYFVMMLALAAILGLASAARYYFVITLGEKVVNHLRSDVFSHVVDLSPGFYDRSHSGEIVSRLSADTTQIKSAVGASVSVALRNIIMAVGAVIMMIITSPKLSTLVLITIPIIVIPLIAFGRKVRVRTRKAQDRLAEANALAGEQIAAIRTVQAFNAQNFVSSQFKKLVDKAFNAARQSVQSRAFLTGFAIFLVFGSVVAVLWIGSNDVLAGKMSGGTLGQFVLYAVFAASSFGQLSEVGAELAQATGAAERIAELLDEKSDITKPQNARAIVKDMGDSVRFDDVSFTYPTRPDFQATHHLSFAVEQGENVAFVGPSGSGKSTIFALLLRFYDPQSGKIFINGQELTLADPTDIRDHIAYVPQDVAIFDGTMRDNIAFGRPDISMAEIENAARAANAYDFIHELPNGFDTEVGERGVTLSGGQKQRIAIARAILRNAPILLLDEATSALDAESEMLVQKALEKLMEGRTTLVIAHRLATVLKADRIMVMENGHIVEQGKHEELVEKSGLYARLAHLQFSNHV